jgi:phenylalanyl-tRNA synthetase alpha chain
VPPEPEVPEGTAPLALAGPERALLTALRSRPEEGQEELHLAEELGLPEDVTRGALQRLRSKQLAIAEEERIETRELTERGEATLQRGLPERRLLRLLEAAPEGVAPDRLAGEGFDEEERSAAIGRLRRLKLLADGIPLRRADGTPDPVPPFPEEKALREIHDGVGGVADPMFQALRKRGLVTVDVEIVRRWRPSTEGRQLPLTSPGQEQLGALTPSMLSSGSWRTAEFRPYDVRAPVPYLANVRPHPYTAWLREFEEILVGLGFQQSEGPLLETEFWNADVLFMPQEHPARSIHDVLSVAGADGPPPPGNLLERVAAAHEGRALAPGEAPLSVGWQYPYDAAVARRPVLRSQTTAVSARYLAHHPKPPFRMYCLDRNFRRDAVDATHHVEFQQCEGVLGGDGVSLRHVVGMFRSLAEAVGIREIKIRPSYFPFTEPSIEGYVRHPLLGWIEVLPGGMFRPEVLRPLGVEVPVAAWGIGVTRLAMVALGVNDIRELFDDDVQRLTGGGR